jgi:DNA-binding NarL/FixJ family response regulator
MKVIHMAAVNFEHPIRIGSVTYSDWFRRSLHASLIDVPNLRVVAEAENSALAFEVVEAYRPDVLLMDVSMPAPNGIEASQVLSSIFPETKIIAFGIYTDQTHVEPALKAGACQYLGKDCSKERLLQTIKECSPIPSEEVGHSPH